jgi:GDP-L-fucose synthase
VGEGEEISIKHVAEEIVKAIDFTGDYKVNSRRLDASRSNKISEAVTPPQFDTTKADGQHRKPASNAKLLALLPDFEFTPFETGKRDVSRWARPNLTQGIGCGGTVQRCKNLSTGS